MLKELYKVLWYYTQFWITRKCDRRPYTFIWRDWIFRHVNIFIGIVAAFYAGMIALSIHHGTAATITGSCGSFILSHLVWGSKWIENQQETPLYDPEKENEKCPK